MTKSAVYPYAVYFRPGVLVGDIAFASPHAGRNVPAGEFIAFIVEAVKWLDILAIAVWLSIARFSSWGRSKEARPRG